MTDPVSVARALRKDEDLTYREIGARLGVNVATAYRWLNPVKLYVLPCEAPGCETPVRVKNKSRLCGSCRAAATASKRLATARLRQTSLTCRDCGESMENPSYFCGFCDLDGSKNLDASRATL